MIKRFCDKCGNEISSKLSERTVPSVIYIESFRITVSIRERSKLSPADICNTCILQLIQQAITTKCSNTL